MTTLNQILSALLLLEREQLGQETSQVMVTFRCLHLCKQCRIPIRITIEINSERCSGEEMVQQPSVDV
jgi:hypothetical protein